jgi:hypothetical protein
MVMMAEPRIASVCFMVCVCLFLFVFCFFDEIADEGKDFKKADCQQWHRESSHQEN